MVSLEEAQFLFNHVFLPLRVPSESDADVFAGVLLQAVLDCAQTFSPNLPSHQRPVWNTVIESIRKWNHVYDSDGFDPDSAVKLIQGMNVGESFMLHIKSQNAALILHKQSSGTIFEAFEVSPTTNAVLESQDALIRTFPARSVMIPERKLKDRRLIDLLVEYMHKLATEPTHCSLESVVKAKTEIKEVRQSPHPRLVTQWFFAFLLSQGQTLSSTVTVTKRTRDDVAWSNALKPWRRSSVWLCIRVTLQLMLERAFHHEGRQIYKLFMLALLCQIKLSVDKSLSSLEEFHIIRVKLARRRMKLDTATIPPRIGKQVTQTLHALRTTMESKWDAIQARERQEIPQISLDRLDRHVLLANSRSVLQSVTTRHQKQVVSVQDDMEVPRSASLTFDSGKLPSGSVFLQADSDEIQVIHAFNAWVENHLVEWAKNTEHDGTTCMRLKTLIRRYFESCTTALGRQPELMSVAILVTMELWVELDKITTAKYPLLQNFSPELPVHCFQPLRLPEYKDMYRLSTVECYLLNRCRKAGAHSNPSLFADPCDNCFGVQHFDQSPELQTLLAEIDAETEERKAKLRAEFQEMKLQYEDCLRTAQPLDHKKWTGMRGGSLRILHDDRNCEKCDLMKEANKLRIRKFEEPLPLDSNLRKSIVFELQPGEIFIAWRDATQTILQEVFSTSVVSGDQIQTTLADFLPLSKYYTCPDRRVGLASTKKAFTKSHYIRDDISTSVEATLIVPHGLEHRFCDAKRPNVWIAEQDRQNLSVTRLCRCKLPNSPYSSLLETIQTSHHSQNNVIARQSKCPPTLSLREFVAFGSLRAGEQLQWINILRSLLMGDIALNSFSTIVLLEQAMHEVGSATDDFGDARRVAHQELRNDKFCDRLVAVVNTILTKVKSNWKECNTLYCCLAVTIRALSLRNVCGDELFWRGIRVIKSIRQTALGWALQLTNQALRLQTHEQVSSNIRELQGRILSAALLAKSTWRVESRWRYMLFDTAEDLTEYVTTSILVADYSKLCKDTKAKQNDAFAWNLLRDRFMVLDMEDAIRGLCRRFSVAISAGIQACWTDLEIEAAWCIQRGPTENWLVSTTQSAKKAVHWNLITGELLVNGRPVSALPDQYSGSLVYKQLFGENVLNVVASDITSMEFMTASLITGNRVYFGRPAKDFVIQSTRDGLTYELLNRSVFQNDLPATIVNQSHPWLCLDTGHLEFRSRHSPWKTEPRNWSVHPSLSQPGLYTMTRHQQFLVDSTRPYGLNICQVFRHFEELEYVEIYYEEHTGDLKIELPRYHLTFSLDIETGRLRCQELAAEIDKNQSIGALYGLKSRLVLSSTNASVYDPKRIVLVPYGPLDISSQDPHVEVKIDTRDVTAINFFQYKIDNSLCKIDAEGNFEGHLFKAYLHAVTASCLSDTLTGCSGTEEALNTLRDSITLTSVPVSKTASEILTNISRLTPLRKFYPDSSSKTVQKIHWQHGLPSLSQHDSFSELATAIATHSVMANFLYTCDKEDVYEYAGDQELRERAQCRASNYVVLDASVTAPAKDRKYSGRDRENQNNWADFFDIVRSMSSWSRPTTPCCADLYSLFEKFSPVTGFSDTFDPAGLADIIAIDLNTHLPAIMRTCISASEEDANRLALQLSLMAFGNKHIVPLVNTLVSFAISPSIKGLGLPLDDVYDLTVGHVVCKDQITAELEPFRYPRMPSMDEGRFATTEDERIEEMNVELQEQQDLVYAAMKAAWPVGSLTFPEPDDLPDYRQAGLFELMQHKLESWQKNEMLHRKCREYASALSFNSPSEMLVCAPNAQVKPGEQVLPALLIYRPSLLHLIQRIKTTEWQSSRPSLTGWDMSLDAFLLSDNSDRNSQHENEIGHARLKQLLARMETTVDGRALDTIEALKASHRALEAQSGRSRVSLSPPDQRLLQLQHSKSINVVQCFLESLKFACCPTTKAENDLQAAGLWQVPNTHSLLRLLSSDRRSQISKECQSILFDFARAISTRQRLARLLHFTMTNDRFALQKEIENKAHSEWDIQEHPDWLLLELQNDFLIRPVQVQVARELMSPTNGVVQLGMGEGKTSVILPMVIAALADRTRLVRIVVIKSLVNEMLQSLSRTLSGLIGRPVFHLPFSRSTPVNTENLQRLSIIRDQIKESGGVLLTLPEHINSFRLMGNDRVVANERGVMSMMLGAQKGLDHSAVDILDECDEILHPRNELVYTSGSPKPLQGTPDRWCVLLDLLQLVASAAGSIANQFQTVIEHTLTSVGAFPHIRLLKEDGYAPLLQLVLNDIKRGTLAPLQKLYQHEESIVGSVVDFISKSEIEGHTSNIVHQAFRKQAQLDCLYLLRGMLAGGHLQAALEKRWFVNYGLDGSRRCMSAVPYRAKSTPAAAAEFAQPDMMILFTALSYYYAGLEAEDLRHCLALLLKSADPTEEYLKWTSAAAVPKEFWSISALNPESDQCVEQMYSIFKMNKDVISFFLKNVVFPREAKEFPQKLCSSAWDLCARGANGMISGFSGTCDVLLPLTVGKTDIQALRHFDAAVLVDILKDRNNRYVYAGDTRGCKLDTDALIGLISNDKSKPSVIIDVGAQILDTNKDAAKQWLWLRRDKMACVYFNDENEKTVLTRNGVEEPWKSSPWKEQAQHCLIFLDEFHTRGTDFQLPDDFTAAVVLGPKLSKDTLVQACMRMRKLAFSQSLVFFGPPEVDYSIRTVLKRSSDHVIGTSDILECVILQSCAAKEQQRPLWIDRGLAWLQRKDAFDKYVRNGGMVLREPYLRAVLEDESHELSKLYAPSTHRPQDARLPPYNVDKSDNVAKELLKQWQTHQKIGVISCFGEQEQEREILHEVEQEREVERPDRVNARTPCVNRELLDIIQSNRPPHKKPSSLRSAFDILACSSLRHKYSSNQWPPYLLATEDFSCPTKIPDGSDTDDFLRPVNWLLVLRGLPHIILISCHEANAYMDDLKKCSVATLLPYHPRVRRESGSFDLFDVYQVSAMPDVTSIDPKARTALRLFAGQLYFNDFKEYTDFCLLLGLWDGKVALKHHVNSIDDSNYVPSKMRSATSGWTSKWKSNPVELIKRFISMRTQQEEWGHTHVGRVLNGQRLTENDFR